jgi:hypothetical protein
MCELSRPIFEKKLKYQISRKFVQVTRNVPCGQTDGQVWRHEGMKKLTVAFRKFANRPASRGLYLVCHEVFVRDVGTETELC